MKISYENSRQKNIDVIENWSKFIKNIFFKKTLVNYKITNNKHIKYI